MGEHLLYNPVIRPATADDVVAILAVMGGVYREYGFIFDPEYEAPDLVRFYETYDQESGAFFVSMIDGKISGTIGIKFIEATVTEIVRLYLDADFRGGGIGQRLLKTAISWAQNRKCDKVSLWSDTRFTQAHKLYAKTGFVKGTMRHLTDVNKSVEYQFTLDLA